MSLKHTHTNPKRWSERHIPPGLWASLQLLSFANQCNPWESIVKNRGSNSVFVSVPSNVSPRVLAGMSPWAKNIEENACYWQEVLLSLSHSEICLLGVSQANWWRGWATVSVAQKRGLRRGPLTLKLTLLKFCLWRTGHLMEHTTVIKDTDNDHWGLTCSLSYLGFQERVKLYKNPVCGFFSILSRRVPSWYHSDSQERSEFLTFVDALGWLPWGILT